MDKTNGLALKTSHYNEDAIKKLDKTVTRVVELLMLSNKKIATAESCTGGLLSELITNVPGASGVFEAGICSYSNRIKNELLGVPQDILDRYTEVSSHTAAAMAEGIKRISGADVCVSVTGIAGPGGGTDDKPVGTVYAGFVYGDQSGTVLYDFSEKGYDRSKIRKLTALSIFSEVERLLSGDDSNE